MIPRVGALAPDQEQAFQAFMAFDPSVRDWRNGFQAKYGEQPNTTNDPSFNYREAYTAGNRPQPYAYDSMPHWDSRGKAPDHPTEWMNDFQNQYGVDPNAAAAAGLTPDQSQMVNGQAYADALAQYVKGLKP